MRTRLRDFFAGVRLVGAGYRVWGSSARLMAIGLIPGVITMALLAGLFVAVAVWSDDWASALVSGITDDPTPPSLAVALVAIALIGGSVLLAVFTFTALTLLIGQPFFERIADAVAESVGLAPTVDDEPWWRGMWRSAGESTILLVIGAAFGIAMFIVGLLPGIGTAVALVCNAAVGGTLLALELTAYPLSRVGIRTLRDRARLAKRHRSLVTGFGATAFLICLVPGGAVLSMPSLVAGGALLGARMAPSSERVVALGGEALRGGEQSVSDGDHRA